MLLCVESLAGCGYIESSVERIYKAQVLPNNDTTT